MISLTFDQAKLVEYLKGKGGNEASLSHLGQRMIEVVLRGRVDTASFFTMEAAGITLDHPDQTPSAAEAVAQAPAPPPPAQREETLLRRKERLEPAGPEDEPTNYSKGWRDGHIAATAAAARAPSSDDAAELAAIKARVELQMRVATEKDVLRALRKEYINGGMLCVKRLAKDAGVSVPMASQVLSGKKRVSDKLARVVGYLKADAYFKMGDM